MTIPASVQKFRDHYIKTRIGRFYSGYAHYLVEVAGVGIALAMASLFLKNVTAIELITIPVVFVFANFVEYMAHRHLLHKLSKLTKTFYHEHTVLHHHYFTDEAIDMQSVIDLHRILFPPIGTFFFIFLVGAPLALSTYFLVNLNVALLVFMTIVSFFLLYETVHLICHLPDETAIFKVPGLMFLKRHHQVHHRLDLMKDYNFNISFPLSDYVLGAVYKDL